MYYYIFDVKKFKKRAQVENIKNHLSVLGISGEYTYPTGAQSVSELVLLALSKQYTTIVAVGGDELINEVAAKLVGKKEAMGIIPIEASAEINQLVGTDNWKEACDILRFRKINDFRLGCTAGGYYFLTKISLDVKAPVEVTIEFKDFLINAKVKNLTISNFSPNIRKIGDDFLDVMFESVSPDSSMTQKLASLFGVRETQNKLAQSIFRARSLRIFTKMKVPILLQGKAIAKTPQYIESTDESLRLITAKKMNFWV